MKKFDFVAYAKYILISVLVLIIAGLTIMGIFGFNKSSEYKNGFEVRVIADEIFGENDTEIMDTTKNFFAVNKINVISVKKIDKGRIVSYTVNKSLTEEQKTNLFKTLNENFTALEIEVSNNQLVNYTNLNQVWWLLLAGGILIILACIYVGIRYKWVSSLVLLCVSVIEVILFIAVTAFTRIVVTTSYLTVVLGGLSLTILFTINFFALISQSRKNVANKDLNSKQFANKAISKNLDVILATLASIILFAAALMVFGSSALLRWVSIQILLAGIVASFTAVFITGALYSFFKKQ